MLRDFRFGLAISNGFGDDPITAAVEAEASGFDVAVIGDHIGPELAPIPTLAAIAGATDSIRLGTMVVNADVRNPVQLAWEAATLDRLSGGRFELGLGAGHTPQEYAAMGLVQDPPAVRKRRLMEAVEVISELLAGRTVTCAGEFFDVTDACVAEPGQRVRLLVGGNGTALLEHAGRHADSVGLQGLSRTLQDGHRHTVRWTTGHLEQQLDQIRAGAGDRFDDIELNALVQVVAVTDDADAATAELCGRVDGLSVDDVAEIPYALIGTVDEIADKLRRCRQRWGISYFVVRDHDQFAPIIAAPIAQLLHLAAISELFCERRGADPARWCIRRRRAICVPTSGGRRQRRTNSPCRASRGSRATDALVVLRHLGGALFGMERPWLLR